MDSVKRLIETIGGKKNICPKEAAAQERRARSLICSNHVAPVAVLPEGRVRMVFSRDSDKKTLLFDSQANMDPKERVNESLLSWSMCDMRCGDKLEQSSGSNGSSGWKRLPLTRQPSTDSQLLGEMIFGSTPMKLHGDTLKVHYMKSTDQLMLTKVFSIRRRPLSSCNLSESESCPTSSVSISPSCSPMPRMSEASLTRHQLFIAKARSSSLNVPSSSSDQGLGPSSYNTSPATPNTHSPTASLGSSTAGAISSSLNKRILRARSTSMENWNWTNLSKKVPRRGVKFALAVIVCLSELSEDDIRKFQHFIFQHFSLIDAHLNELRESTEDAFVTLRQDAFKAAMEQAYQKFLHNFVCLYSAQRIENPVWLSLVSQESNRKVICRQFMEELGSAITELDTKETKYFLSSVLTEVLAHHLAWIHTVSDLDTSRQSRRSKSLSVLAESHPYNPLWAQLGDLYGAVATPLTISRTIVTGQSAALVCRLLYILSYFIRCSEIQPGTEFKAETTWKETGPQACGDRPRWDIGSDLDASDVFEESQSSALTLQSEHDRSYFPVMSPACGGSCRDTPLVKPHPFSFKSASNDLHRGSHEDSDNQISSPSEHSMKSSHKLSLELISSTSKASSPLSTGSRTAPSTATATPTSTIMTTPTSHTPLQRYQPEAMTENNKRSLSVICAGSKEVAQNCHCHDNPPPPAEMSSQNSNGSNFRSEVEEMAFSKYHCHGDTFTHDVRVRPSLQGGSGDVCAPPNGGVVSSDTLLPPKPYLRGASSSIPEYYRTTAEVHVFSNSLDSGYDPSGPPLSRCSTLSSHLSSYQAHDDSLLDDQVEGDRRNTAVRVDLPASSGLDQQPDLDPCLSLVPSLDPRRRHAPPLHGTGVFGRFGTCMGGLSACLEGDSPRTAGIAMINPLEDAAIGDDHALEQPTRPEVVTSAGIAPRVCVSLPLSRDMWDPAHKPDFDSLPTCRDHHATNVSGANHERIHALYQRYRNLSDNTTSSLEFDVEGGLPCVGGALQRSTSLLGHKLEQYNRSLELGDVPRMSQFADFVPVSLPSLQDFDLEEEGAIFDFGHSLLVGHSTTYLPDFVLHGTSQSYSTFKEDLIGDLTNVIKHSIIDEPVEHGLAVVANTDTWTSQLVCVSKNGPAVADTSVTVPSQYIQQLLKSLKGMWEMRMPSEFCLSHLENGLLALNEKGKLLADTLSEKVSPQLGDNELARAQETLSIHNMDLPLLLSLAAVHCRDAGLASTIRHKSLQVAIGRKVPR